MFAVATMPHGPLITNPPAKFMPGTGCAALGRRVAFIASRQARQIIAALRGLEIGRRDRRSNRLGHIANQIFHRGKND